jgi:Ca2+-binding RTX toxin-like protein
VIDGGAGDDTIRGGAGADTIDGGDGNDTLDESDHTSGVVVDLTKGVAGDGTVTNVENVIGGAGPDQITGDAAPNRLLGGPGDDHINSVDTSADTVDCGDGNDTVTADGRDTLLNCETRLPLPLALDGTKPAAGTVRLFDVGCPAAAVQFCQGTLVVRQLARRLAFGVPQPLGPLRWIVVAAVPFRIPAGGDQTIKAVFTTPPAAVTQIGRALSAAIPVGAPPASMFQTSVDSVDAAGVHIDLLSTFALQRATPLQVSDRTTGWHAGTLTVQVRCGGNARPGCAGTVQLWSVAAGSLSVVPLKALLRSAPISATPRLHDSDVRLPLPLAARRGVRYVALVVTAHDAHGRSILYKHLIKVQRR